MRDATTLRRAIELRAQLNALIRRFFADRGVVEVETPILSQAGNTEPNIESFSTAFCGHVAAGLARTLDAHVTRACDEASCSRSASATVTS